MASRSWFYRAIDSRFWKAIERLMLKLPYPLRFGIVFLVFIVVVVIAVLLEGLITWIRPPLAELMSVGVPRRPMAHRYFNVGARNHG